jgi:hypothetical protein
MTKRERLKSAVMTVETLEDGVFEEAGEVGAVGALAEVGGEGGGSFGTAQLVVRVTAVEARRLSFMSTRFRYKGGLLVIGPRSVMKMANVARELPPPRGNETLPAGRTRHWPAGLV